MANKSTTLGKLIPSEYIDSMSKTAGEYSDKVGKSMSDLTGKLFGQAADKMCEKAGVICFEKKRLIITAIILVVIALILAAVAAYLAYQMGKQYIDITANGNEQTIQRPQYEPYIDNEGEAYNY